MGLGDFLSSKAETEFEAAESAREKAEFASDPAHEIKEHAQLLVDRGVDKADATQLAETLARYPDVFHAAHLPLELGMSAPDGSATPAMDGFVTFLSFIIFGSVPMFTYVVLFYSCVLRMRAAPSALPAPRDAHRPPPPSPRPDSHSGVRQNATIFGVACAMTAVTLFALGWTQATITGQRRLRTGTLMTINGGLAAAAAYLVGWGLEHAVGTGV